MANRVPTAYTIRELDPRTVPDCETLAVKQGGCWCIFYQRAKPLRRGTTSEEWKRRNRRDKRRLVREGRSHAILVYDGKTAIGWCQYGDRNELSRIDARRTYRKAAPPVGDVKLWRITCFFVDPKYRAPGVALRSTCRLGSAMHVVRPSSPTDRGPPSTRTAPGSPSSRSSFPSCGSESMASRSSRSASWAVSSSRTGPTTSTRRSGGSRCLS